MTANQKRNETATHTVRQRTSTGVSKGALPMNNQPPIATVSKRVL